MMKCYVFRQGCSAAWHYVCRSRRCTCKIEVQHVGDYRFFVDNDRDCDHLCTEVLECNVQAISHLPLVL